ncbi:MAG: YdcF family protein [Bacteroidia bacterium]
MFFILSKVFAFLLMPFTWAMLLLLWAILSKKPVVKRRALLAGILVLYLFSNRFVLDSVMRAWEIPATPEPAAGTYDAIIVLGGTRAWDEQLDRVQFTRGGDRLFQGLQLMRKGVAPKLIFTGGSGSLRNQDKLEANWINSWLNRAGLNDSNIVFENKSRNTHENAAFTKPLLGSGNGRYLLVTSAFHMRRSVACFAHEGIKVVPYSADRYSGGPPRYQLDYLLLPESDVMQGWNQLMHEWVGCISYSISGYI